MGTSLLFVQGQGLEENGSHTSHVHGVGICPGDCPVKYTSSSWQAVLYNGSEQLQFQ